MIYRRIIVQREHAMKAPHGFIALARGMNCDNQLARNRLTLVGVLIVHTDQLFAEKTAHSALLVVPYQ